MRTNKQINNILTGVVTAAVVVGLAGCGGSSSSGPASPIANSLRTLKPGDAWQYAVTGHVHTSIPNSRDPQVQNGTFSRSIQTANTGGLSLTEQSVIPFSVPDLATTSNQVEDIVQDPTTGDVGKVDDTLGDSNGNFETADSGTQEIIPGAWTAATGMSSSSSYTVSTLQPNGTTTVHTGNQEQFSLTVVGQEVISTPAGTFTTWKCNISSHILTQDITIGGTAWWAPQLGTFVRMDTTQTVPTGVKYLTYTLTSTTVPH